MKIAFALMIAFILYWYFIALIFVNSEKFYKGLSSFAPETLKRPFLDAEKTVGKSTRSEYLYWNLFLFILNTILILSLILLSGLAQVLSIILVIMAFTLNLILLPPSISVTLRRLNDNSFSKKFILLVFAPLGGLILFSMCLINRNQVKPYSNTLSL